MTGAAGTGVRHFLFLQGNASWFFRRLGEGLAARGYGVTRVNVCGGDRLFWGRDDWNAVDYKGRPEAFDVFLSDLYAGRGITDIILHNDCRTTHRVAIAAARRAGIGIWVYEEGYLRPHWLTLEREGINGYSRLPDDPDWYRTTARTLSAGEGESAVGPGLRERILLDFRWQAANYTMALRYRHYRTHRPYPIWAEYATWGTRLAVLRHRHRVANRVTEDHARGDTPYHLFALQLDSDSQIRIHSAFVTLPAAVAAVIANFAVHAPAGHRLIIKNHPLDNGWICYPRLIRRLARQHGISDRVVFIDGGDLNRLIDHADGVVTVNSTVGLTGIERDRPVICLGEAIYDIAGLTFQGTLAAFWHAPPRPDLALYADFRKVLMHACLVNGNYYTDPGMALAVANSIARMEEDSDFLALAPPRRRRPQDRLGTG